MMARRRELGGICDSLLGTFISRNNSPHGYWGLGFLKASLEASDVPVIRIDLLGKDSSGSDPVAQIRAKHARWLDERLQARGLLREVLVSAALLVESVPGGLACSAVIETDLGRKFVSRARVSVRPHDPRREARSARPGP